MAIGTQTVSINNAQKFLIIATDGSGNIAPAHVNINSSGTEVGVVGSPLYVLNNGATTSTLTNVTAVTTGAAANILAMNVMRMRFILFNDSNAIAYILEGSGVASPTNYSYQISAGQYYSTTDWKGAVSAVWSAVNGTMRITEQTA